VRLSVFRDLAGNKTAQDSATHSWHPGMTDHFASRSQCRHKLTSYFSVID
jgi:hypothetical protein